MGLLVWCRQRVAHWPYSAISVLAAFASFGCYTCMYAFRKAFAAGIFNDGQYLHIDYKVWLVIAQVIGYTLSKFYGIRFIAEVKPGARAKSILFLIGLAWAALLLFAVIPAPWNIICLFLNGFPLGMIWGLVFGYLEGRRSTEFMAAVMSISLIFASGFVKTTGRSLMSTGHVTEYWMPFITGLLFVLPLLLFVALLEMIPPPDEKDRQLRTSRGPMSAADRKKFVLSFLPGILLTAIIYVLLTVMRDVRDNFEVEIWADLGIRNNQIYTQTDTLISMIVLVMMSLLILIRNNRTAFSVVHSMIITGCLLVGFSTFLFERHAIGPVSWMSLAGLGLYLGYIPYNAIFFERMIATFRYKSNVGFIMYIADAIGYLGSVSVLLIKEFDAGSISWGHFFQRGVLIVSIAGSICAAASLIYFLRKASRQEIASSTLQLSVI